MSNYSSVVNTFLEIVQIDSPTFHEEKMSQDIFARLKKMGLTPQIDQEGNVIAFLDGDSTKETYLLNAHLDTVEDPADGTIHPHVDNDGWIVSDGSTILGADNKTAVAAILDTIDRLVSNGDKNHHPLEIIFTVSEESGNHGAHGLDYSKLISKRGFCFDFGGRNFGDMVISSPFYNRFDINLTGKAAHASHPELASNVLPVFANSFSKLKLGAVSQDTVTNIGIVSVGRVGGPVNTIPGEMVISGEVRSHNELELEQITKNIEDTFEIESKKLGVVSTFKKTRENDGFRFDINNPFIQNVLHQLSLLGITNPDIINSWGCYEANIFAAHGIMVLNIADGSLDNHAKTERIKVTNLEKLANLVYQLVIN